MKLASARNMRKIILAHFKRERSTLRAMSALKEERKKMTIKELIEELKKFDKDLDVYSAFEDGKKLREITGVSIFREGGRFKTIVVVKHD